MFRRPRLFGRSLCPRTLVAPRAVLISILAAGTLGASALAAAAPADASQRSDVQRELQALVGMPGGPPGALVDMERGGDRIVFRARVADIAGGRRPKPSDFMRIASVAKAFSGAVALLLVESGRLKLDDTIARRLPSLPAAWGAVTLRELLQHTSGLPDYSGAAAFRAIFIADPHHRFDSRRLLSFVASEPLLFHPGSQYRYSNSDNIAIALMAEAATGHRYEDLLDRLVYDRLGMRRTSLPQGFLLPKPYLHGYTVPPSGSPQDVSTLAGASGAWASGGIVSTPSELNTFIENYAGPELLSRSVRREQLKFVAGASEPAGPGRNSAGLGIFRYATRCGVVYGHTGNFFGYTQLAVASPDGERSLTFTVNEQINEASNSTLLAKLRAVQEDFVCEMLRH
jgi:D-alanyl-D-alanine carboxypeptidase